MFKTLIAVCVLMATADAHKLNQSPVANICTNINKTDADNAASDQDCSTAGNSAWNTHTTSRTADPEQSLTPPYPDHAKH